MIALFYLWEAYNSHVSQDWQEATVIFRFSKLPFLELKIPKCFLRGIHYVEESIFIFLAVVHVKNGRCVGDHAMVVHKKEECLMRVQLKPSPAETTKYMHYSTMLCIKWMGTG